MRPPTPEKMKSRDFLSKLQPLEYEKKHHRDSKSLKVGFDIKKP